ncbi:PH domain-containing protein [Marinihelvus fidelis]|nr:PH domain-containing protein [Marinihelvus fidelis]
MTFTNPQLDTDRLPRAAALDLHPLPPEHRREILVQSAIVVTVFLLLSLVPQAIVAIPSPVRVALLALPAAALLLGGLLTVLAVVRFRRKGYALRAHDVVFRTGLFWRKTTVLPFDRVQHAEVTHGPLQRRFGLATLKFFTAGGSSVDLQIEGLLAADAERLRETVLARSGHG